MRCVFRHLCRNTTSVVDVGDAGLVVRRVISSIVARARAAAWTSGPTRRTRGACLSRRHDEVQNTVHYTIHYTFF